MISDTPIISCLKACIPAFHQYFLTEHQLQDPKSCFAAKYQFLKMFTLRSVFADCGPYCYRISYAVAQLATVMVLLLNYRQIVALFITSCNAWRIAVL